MSDREANVNQLQSDINSKTSVVNLSSESRDEIPQADNSIDVGQALSVPRNTSSMIVSTSDTHSNLGQSQSNINYAIALNDFSSESELEGSNVSLFNSLSECHYNSPVTPTSYISLPDMPSPSFSYESRIIEPFFPTGAWTYANPIPFVPDSSDSHVRECLYTSLSDSALEAGASEISIFDVEGVSNPGSHDGEDVSISAPEQSVNLSSIMNLITYFGEYEMIPRIPERLFPEVEEERINVVDINEFPSRIYEVSLEQSLSRDEDSADELNSQCKVCFAEFQVGQILSRLPCLHEFHLPCIHTWLKRSLTCPLCRSDVSFHSDE